MLPTPADRVQAFLDRYERTHPSATVLWSGSDDRATSMRLADLHALIDHVATAAPQETE